MEKIFNKLVRDKIPEIIEADGEKPDVEVLDPEKKKKELFNKLKEEVNEVTEAQNEAGLKKEIGDVLEVLEEIIKCYGLDEGEIREIQKKRREERGGFSKGVYLKKTTE